MFGIKSWFKKKLFNLGGDKKFPEKPVGFVKRKAKLASLLYELKKQENEAGLSDLVSIVRSEAVDVWRRLLPYNPNNLGNWSVKSKKPNQATSTIERETVFKMIDLYSGKKRELEGYFTSGGTEGNIFSSWLGRKSLEEKGVKDKETCLIKTSLTHYSLDKGADIVNLPSFVTPLNKKSWGMDKTGLEKTVKKLTKKRYKGFLLPLTLGYTLTGSSDPVEDILSGVEKMEKDLNVAFFVWIDAAFNGLTEPFLAEDFTPFDSSYIQTFLTDFHKTGFSPIPSGLILYRKKLRSLIERPVDYIEQKDNTLLGSRTGIAPVSCWVVINSLGREGFKKVISLKKKEMESVVKIFEKEKGLKPLVFPGSLHCGIMSERRRPNQTGVAKKYGLDFRKTKVKFVDEEKELLISKSFFLR